MTIVAYACFALLALAGHVGLWNGLINRLHGTGLERWTMKAITLLWRALVVFPPLIAAGLALAWALRNDLPLASLGDATYDELVDRDAWPGYWIWRYAAFSAAIALVYYPRWLFDRLRRRPMFLDTRRRTIDIERELGGRPLTGLWSNAWARLPRNQLLKPELVEHTLEIARLPPALDGLSLMHLTDMHISGRMLRPYYRRMMELVAEHEPDILCVTGDLCEEAQYIPLVAEMIALAPARAGKFFVLGNHDSRTHAVPELCAALEAVGCRNLMGVWREITIRGARVTLGGDARPWHNEPLDPRAPGPRDPHVPEFRLVLMHSPDRLKVAVAADADFSLAGHTHGGQIRIPGIGAIVCPSIHGLRYDMGLFGKGSTLLYVGRGLCSLTPVRLDCRPELARFVFRAPRSG